MGTTVWVDDDTRTALRRLQEELGTDSVNATLQALLRRPAPDARMLFGMHREAVAAILERHHLRSLVAFGSRARGEATEASDLDLATEVDPDADPMAVLAAEADLEEVLGVPVDLVELPNPRLQDVIEREGVSFAA